MMPMHAKPTSQSDMDFFISQATKSNTLYEDFELCANTMTQLIAHTLAKAFQTQQRNLEDLRSIQFSTQ